jgi:two-component system, NtrC family, nitrogen regulation response regulator GlnG
MNVDDPVRETYDGTTDARDVTGPVSVVLLTILHHPDVTRVGECESLADLGPGREALLSRETPDFAPPGGGIRLPLEDACVSRLPLCLRGLEGGGVRILVGESRTNVVYRGVALKDAADVSAAELEHGVVLRLGGRIVLLLQRARISDMPGGDAFGLVGESPGIHRVRAEIRRAAAIDLPVLIRGETGTGKELVARAVHGASARRDRPFVAVNLAAVPPGLAGSELFGAERGAFTGSVRPQPGYFRMAQGGTLFLDEIGEAPPEVQVMLLRALETGEVQTVGSQQVQTADVRILAATDADLSAKIRDGSFRAPLLHRLSTYEITLPPLRERRDDVARLLIRFLQEELEKVGAAHRLAPPAKGGSEWLPASIVARLAQLSWPGNVRQLRNVARQMVISNVELPRVELGPAVERLLEETPAEARLPSLPDSGVVPETVPPPRGRGSSPRSRKPADISHAQLSEALRASRWDIAAAADQLGISRASMYVLMEREPRIRTAGDLSADEITLCYRECEGNLERMGERLEVSEKALRRRARELGLATS